jgi:Domain of unknown function (DUF1841)
MFNPSRSEARDFFFEAWRKYRAGEPVSPLEALAADLVLQHPEYHAVLAAPEEHRARDFDEGRGGANPFLHLATHLAIEEQVSIDQPPGIRAQFERLAAKSEPHDARHKLMECLARTLWQAQSTRQPLDADFYLECLRRQG